MKRLIVALLLLLLAVLTIPPLRARAQPQIDQSREWLGEKLEGPLSPVLGWYRTLKTESRMDKAVTLLVQDRTFGMRLPEPQAFEGYLRRHDVEPVDGWQLPLILRQEGDSLAVISAGPDLLYDTEDDLVAKIEYAGSRGRTRGRR